eukprot:GHVN01079520.1.p1 GENE.GHVN01079520.1~~GHVN01079520.1.p1  ORF type:complete len:123 (+),score=21.55 GHVN01079520.1:82-450(+)
MVRNIFVVLLLSLTCLSDGEGITGMIKPRDDVFVGCEGKKCLREAEGPWGGEEQQARKFIVLPVLVDQTPSLTPYDKLVPYHDAHRSLARQPPPDFCCCPTPCGDCTCRDRSHTFDVSEVRR